jgi:hypothetical protein
MKAAHARCVSIFCLSSVFTVLASGCAVSQKSFSIDSNSRVPFFGLELQERKSKSKVPTYNSINRSDAQTSRVETVARTLNPGKAKRLSKKSDGVLTAVNGFEVDNSASNRIADANDAAKSCPILSIPLPTTEMRQQTATTTVIDFQ